MLDRIVDPVGEAAPLLVLADIEKVLEQDDAVVDDLFSIDGTRRMKRSYSSLLQNPITRSTPARLYQDRSNSTISPAAGKWAMYRWM